MKLKIVLSLLFGLCILSLGSCRKREKLKSLSELKSEQEDNIKRLLTQNRWKVTDLSDDQLPNTIDPNVFYHFSNGLYMRVLNAGEGKAIVNKTKVFLYIRGYLSQKERESYYDFNSISDGSFMPIYFLYSNLYIEGQINFKTINQVPNGYSLNTLMCQGLAYPMTMLGNNAKVMLIIPFELGPLFSYNTGASLVITEATYQFAKN